MPLLGGKKNIGKNIATEERAGKPAAQAKAIALHVAAVPKKDAIEEYMDSIRRGDSEAASKFMRNK